ncbi:MAG: NUDIX hydrolase, partial [Candidatus Woesearchaeota archaeon]
KDHPWIGVDVIIVDKGKILLMKRADCSKTFPGKWCIPGGTVEWGETAEQALKREAQEEIGCEIEVIKFVGRVYDSPKRHPTKTMFALPHLCKIVSGTPQANQPEEVAEVKWFTPQEVKELDMAYDHKKMLEDERLI